VTDRGRLVGLFAVSALAFGTGFVGIKAGVAALPPVLFAALRYDLGAAVLLTYVALRRSYWRPRTAADVRGVVVAAVFLVTLNGVFLFVGQQSTTTATAAVLYALLPVATPLLSALLLPDERVTALGAAGILLGFAGVTLVVGADPSALAGGSTGGQLLVVGGAISVALGSVLLRRVGPDMGSLALTAWAMGLGAVATHLVGLALGEGVAVAWTPVAVGAVLYVGVLSTAVAFPAYFALIREVGAVRANLVSYVVPVVAAVAGAVVLGETVEPGTVVGFLVVSAGFFLVENARVASALAAVRGRPAPEAERRAGQGTGADGTGCDPAEYPFRPDGGTATGEPGAREGRGGDDGRGDGAGRRHADRPAPPSP
jgi:drug/metabolite transporter (DMT)-like permease